MCRQCVIENLAIQKIMAETSSDCGRKKAKVDGSLDGSSASSRKFDGAARFKSKFQPFWSKK